MRTGLVAKKIGMTRKFDDKGVHVPLTVLKLEETFISAVMTDEKNGYNAVQLATDKAKVKNTSKQMRGHFAKAKTEPQKCVREFRTSKENSDIQTGQKLSVVHFLPGQYVDVVGQSKGKGMAGVVKRWNFSTTYRVNNSKAHRIHGSTGACQDPGRVWKNKKMAGHMGDERVTVQNLIVYGVDEENQLIFVRGAVPGAKNSYVMISDAKKKAAPKDLPAFGLFAEKSKKDEVVADAEQSTDVAQDSQPKAEAVASEPTNAVEPKADTAEKADDKKDA